MNSDTITQHNPGISNGTVITSGNSDIIQQDSSTLLYDSTFSVFPLINQVHTVKLSRSPVFMSHELRPEKFQPIARENTSNDWTFLLLFVCVALFTWVQIYYRKRFIQIFQSLFSEKRVNFLIRDGHLFNEQITLALGFIFVMGSSLFLFLINKFLIGLSLGNGIFLFLKIVLALVGFIIIKFILIQLIKAIFLTKEATSRYVLNSLIFDLSLGVILLPFLIFITYTGSDILIYLFLSIASITFIYKLLRGFIIGLSYSGFSLFYLFLYLCTVEVLPVVVVVKLLVS
jgi:hypothetical protein